jgi:hypothetical protein
MAALKDKVENALNESRILLLGGQVLIGAGFRSILSTGFDRLPTHVQILAMTALGSMNVGLGLLLVPSGYHYVVERGNNTPTLRY